MKPGLVLAAILGLADLGLLLGGGDYPPRSVVVVSALLGVVTLAAVAWAWRGGSRTAVWLVIGSRVISALGALPAFFVADVPAAARIAAAVLVALTAAAVGLLGRARAFATPAAARR
jgi:uncharacterized membrane protein YfcA